MPRLRYLLLQTRNSDDAMREQEVRCFARVLQCDAADVGVVDLLARGPSPAELAQADMLLLGGAGHYSAASEPGRPRPRSVSEPGRPRPRSASEPGRGHRPPRRMVGPRTAWLDRALDVLRDIHRRSRPTFASCWGFQAMSRAMGGRCIHDPSHAELGTIELQLTEAGRADPLFGTLPPAFCGQAGHEDHVVQLPADAVLLASSPRVRNQAFHFAGKPIYCTQFHPELNCMAMLERVRAYPDYVERIAASSYDQFVASCRETPEANTLLRRFVELVFG